MKHSGKGRKSRNRAKLLAAMRDGPLTVVQLRHRTGLGETTVRHHLAELDAEGRIGTKRCKAPSGRGRAFFLKEAP
jgi:predicted ArsR family transcriptional regulator